MSHPLFQLLQRIEDAKIHFTLSRNREDTVLVTLTLVGERVEVDVFEDGHMEVSRFPGSEDIVGGTELVERLIDENRLIGLTIRCSPYEGCQYAVSV